MYRILRYVINTNVFISLAVVMLALETQVQLGFSPQWHPYLLIIFFATMFEYNLHRVVTYFLYKDVLHTDKYKWLRENKRLFFFMVFVSVIGFVLAICLAKREVLIALLPVAFITLFYSVPFAKVDNRWIRFRNIPFLKIFIISFSWSYCSLLLPIAYSDVHFDKVHLSLIFIERFLFIFSITIPFDIRDMEADKNKELKTIPLLLGERAALRLACFALLLFLILSVVHYVTYDNYIVLIAFVFSAVSAFYFLVDPKIKNLSLYHYGVLDGTLLLQGLLVLLLHFF